MGVNLYIEDENGAQLAEVLDPRGFVGRIVSLVGNQATICLRFIDPYGNTVFNQLQILTLIRELETAREQVTDELVAKLAQEFLEKARKARWSPAVIQEIESSNRSVSASDIRGHMERMLALALRAQGKVHTYLKFYGD